MINKIMNFIDSRNETQLTKYLVIGALFSMLLGVALCAVPVYADDNITDITNATDESTDLEIIYYKDTEQYKTDFEYWYGYYTQDRLLGYESTLRDNLKSYMDNTAMSDSERWTAMLIIMGYDFRLENYLNPDKRTIDDITGAVSYSLGVGNWWANLFGNGTKAETLPQTIAEGDALYKIYQENYQSYFDLILEDDIE